MKVRPARWLAALCLLQALSGAAQTISSPAEDIPAANPGRPTVSNPATLPPVGYLQFEQGYLGAVDSPATASQYGVNQVTRLAIASRAELLFSWQPFAVSGAAGQPGFSNHAGSVQLGGQLVLFTPPTPHPAVRTGASPPATAAATSTPPKTPVPTVAVNYQHTVYAGTAPDIDLGSATNSLVLLFSGDFGGWHYDTNYIVNEQDGALPSAAGLPAGATHAVRRAQYAQTLSVDHAIGNPSLQLSVELYRFTQPLVDATASGRRIARANLVDVLFAPSYAVRPNLVLDAGFARGLTSTSTQWQSFAGFTYLLPHRLWRKQ